MLKTNIPKIPVPLEEYAWLREECRRLLDECRFTAHDGTLLYTPDAQRHYAALWTRDFTYMVEGAPRLLPIGDIRAGIEFILRGQRNDGAIPDRVEPDGTPVYLAGPKDRPLGNRPPTDNPQFLVKLVSEYFTLTRDFAFVEARMEALWRGLLSVPVSSDGVVFVDPSNPHSAYGFTDTIAKTGPELFSSLLMWEAWRLMGEMARHLEDHDQAHEAYERAERLQRALGQFWDDEFGMMWAAMHDCKQFDLWGGAYAVRIGAVGSMQRHRIAQFFADLYHSCVLRGYVRHLVAGQYWERLIVPVPPDTYQNGGYWAVPSGWVARCLLSAGYTELAKTLIRDLIAEFRTEGVCEWISESERALPGYVASVALLLDSVKPQKAND